MPQRSRVRQLPAEVRQELNQRLIDGGFAGYSALADWLAEHGHEISRSAVHRYGAALERRIEMLRTATEQAEALVEASGDETGAMADASIRIVQQRFFEALLSAEDGEVDLKALSGAGRAVADAARAGATIRAERRKVLAAAAETAERAARESSERAGRPLPPEVLREIRERVYGLREFAP